MGIGECIVAVIGLLCATLLGICIIYRDFIEKDMSKNKKGGK